MENKDQKESKIRSVLENLFKNRTPKEGITFMKVYLKGCRHVMTLSLWLNIILSITVPLLALSVIWESYELRNQNKLLIEVIKSQIK